MAAEIDGTAAFAGVPTWTEYRATVRLRSSAQGLVGVYVRQNGTQSYRLELDFVGGNVRLLANDGGGTTPLWQDSREFVADRNYVVTIDCAGDLIRGYLDGEQLFEVVHAGHGTGGIGLYTHANPTSVSEEVVVTTPRWGTYHRFRNQSTMAAGTRLRLQADRRLLADGPLALRVVGADSRVQHRRSFVPASHYAPITPRRGSSASPTVPRSPGRSRRRSAHRRPPPAAVRVRARAGRRNAREALGARRPHAGGHHDRDRCATLGA